MSPRVPLRTVTRFSHTLWVQNPPWFPPSSKKETRFPMFPLSPCAIAAPPGAVAQTRAPTPPATERNVIGVRRPVYTGKNTVHTCETSPHWWFQLIKNHGFCNIDLLFLIIKFTLILYNYCIICVFSLFTGFVIPGKVATLMKPCEPLKQQLDQWNFRAALSRSPGGGGTCVVGCLVTCPSAGMTECSRRMRLVLLLCWKTWQRKHSRYL